MAEPSSSEYDLAPPPAGIIPQGPPGRPADGGAAGPSTPRKGPPPPPKPLPRISRSAPLSAEEADAQEARPGAPGPRPSRKERRQAREAERAASRGDDDAESRMLVAPTPRLDTVDTRHTIRLALGIAAGLAVLLAIFMVVRAVGGGGGADEEGVYVINSAEMFRPVDQVDPRVARNADQEGPARDLFQRARSALSIDLCRAQLQRVVDGYPNTRTAVEARAALDRIARGLSPFPDVPSLTPSGTAVAVAAANPAVAPVPAAVEPEAEAEATDPAADTALPTVAEPPPPQEPVLRVLPEGFAAASDAVEDASGWPSRIVGDRDGATMVLVPGGVYFMGRDGGPPSEVPAHKVELPPFYIDEHEVTVGQFARYREAMARRGETALPAPEDLTRLGLSDRHPVVMTSALEALRYAEWAGKALPTEAQWEAAARGPEGLIRPWGGTAPPWTDRRAPRSIDPVASFPADRSPAGAFDLAANAWEWTADWFAGDAYASRASRLVFNPGGPARAPTNPPRQTVRGSSPEHDATYRTGMRVDTRLPYLGFRCALNVEGLPLPGDPPPPAATSPVSPEPTDAPPPAPPPAAPPRVDSGGLVPF